MFASLQPPPPVTSENPQAELGGGAGLEAGTGLPRWGPPRTHGTLTPGSHPASASSAQTVPAAEAHTFLLEQLPPVWVGRRGRWGRQSSERYRSCQHGLCRAFPPPQKDKRDCFQPRPISASCVLGLWGKFPTFSGPQAPHWGNWTRALLPRAGRGPWLTRGSPAAQGWRTQPWHSGP